MLTACSLNCLLIVLVCRTNEIAIDNLWTAIQFRAWFFLPSPPVDNSMVTQSSNSVDISTSPISHTEELDGSTVPNDPLAIPISGPPKLDLAPISNMPGPLPNPLSEQPQSDSVINDRQRKTEGDDCSMTTATSGPMEVENTPPISSAQAGTIGQKRHTWVVLSIQSLVVFLASNLAEFYFGSPNAFYLSITWA